MPVTYIISILRQSQWIVRYCLFDEPSQLHAKLPAGLATARLDIKSGLPSELVSVRLGLPSGYKIIFGLSLKPYKGTYNELFCHLIACLILCF